MDFAYQLLEPEWILFLNRIILGVIMLYWGIPKMKDLESNTKEFAQMGFRPPIFWGSIVALLEFFGGILVIIGLYAEFFALLFAVQMFVGTVYKVAKTNKSFGQWSYDLTLLAMSLVLFSFGSGSFTLISNF